MQAEKKSRTMKSPAGFLFAPDPLISSNHAGMKLGGGAALDFLSACIQA
jgi:hypothetical protein